MLRFDEIIGNEKIIKNLRNAMKNGRVSHAYILSGPYGIGKMLLAETFAVALQCEEGVGKACGVCSSCKTTESHNNPDIFYVTAQKTKSLGADDIRDQVLKQVETKQYRYRYKIFIIEHADKMTVAAQNVFLKTLEEPPEYAVFLLLAENPDLLLQTVLSRCVMLKMRSLGNLQVEDYLEKNLGISKDEASFFAEYSAGSIGKAIKLIKDEDFIEMRNDITERMYLISETELSQVINWSKELEKYKDNISDCLDIAYLWFRDVLAAKKLKDLKFLIQKDKEQKIFSQAEKLDFSIIKKSLSAIWQAKRQLEQNGNFQLTIEIMLMNIKGV